MLLPYLLLSKFIHVDKTNKLIHSLCTVFQLTSQGDVFSQHVRSSDGRLLVQESDQTDGRESISSDDAENSAHLDESQPVSPDMAAPQEKNPAAVSIFAGKERI